MHFCRCPPPIRRGEEAFPRADGDGSLLYDVVDYRATWGAMEQLLTKGLVRAIGLSNFNKRQLDEVVAAACVKPAVLQVACRLIGVSPDQHRGGGGWGIMRIMASIPPPKKRV